MLPRRGDLAQALTAIKNCPGRDIVLIGSPTLVRSLLAAGVLGELNLLIHPVVLGTGRRLFDAPTATTVLTLVRADTFSTGVVDLTYTTRPTPR